MKNILRVILFVPILLAFITFTSLILTNTTAPIFNLILILVSLLGVLYLSKKHNFKYLQILNIICIVLGVVTTILN